MSDREPAEEHKLIIDEAIHLRGRIVSHYSHAEFLLSDIVVKCQSISEYKNSDFKFPYRLETKLAAVRKLAESVGPLNKYCERICELIDGIVSFEEMRHFMAHGWMMFKYNKTGHLIEFRLYTQAKDQPLKLGFASFNINQMRGLSEDLSNFVSKMIGLFREIYLNEGLESNT